MRGQAASEFLLILGFILLLILPAGYYVFTQTSESSRVLQADLAVSSLAKTADYIYYQAPGAKQLVDVFVPGGIEWASSYMGHPTALGGQEINLAVYTQTGGLTDVFADTQGEVRGSWPGNSGNFRFQVKKMPGGYVLISPYELGFLLSPTSYSANLQPGQNTNFTLNATEIEGYNKTISLEAMGDISSWISLGDSSLELGASSSNSTTATITVPAGTAFGQYTGYVQASDGNATATTYITVIVTGTGTGGGIEGGLLVDIIEPTNTTYTSYPINLTYTVNDSTDWCGYTINDGPVVGIAGNTSIMTTGGPQDLLLMCVSSDGKSGTDEVWFTTNYGPEPWCFNASLLWAVDGEYNNETENVRYSDDIWADEPNVKSDTLAFIEGTFSFALPGSGSNTVIYNMTEWVEHHEGDMPGIGGITPILQWLTSTGWGKTVCNLPQSAWSDQIDSCTLNKTNISSTIGQASWISTRVDYLSQSSSAKTAYIDWMALQICYGEAIDELDIVSPENTTYTISSLWFNVSSNAMLESAWYSLDSGANQSMGVVNKTASSYVSGLSNGSHTVTFYANDTNNNWLSNSTVFTVNSTAPVTTCVNLSLDYALDSQNEDETADVQASDDTRADITGISLINSQWLATNFSGSVPAGATINNATAYVEHYESSSSVSSALQWYSGGWSSVCTLPYRSSDATDSCTLSDVDTVAEANDLDIRMYYTTSSFFGSKKAYVDFERVLVCYTV